MRKLAAQIIVAAAASSAAFAQSPSVNDEFSTFVGWWRLESDIHACDERKVDRLMSISRPQYGANGWHVETPNGSCELSNLISDMEAGGTIEAEASCPPATSTHSGVAKFFQLSSGRFYVETPIFDGVLFSCDGFVPPEIQNVAGPQSPASAVAALEALTGWWRYDNATFGCDDTDGMTRTLLGRYDFDDNRELTASDGPLRFGFYEGECELTDPVFRDGKLAATAMCVSEGEASKGRLTIEALGDTSILVTSPALNDVKLVACDPGQVAGITALAETTSNTVGVGPAGTSKPPATPLVGSTPLPTTIPVILPITEAAHLNPQRNAVARVIADNCQPDFYETGHWGNGEWDATYYGRYERQLMVKYLSNCEAFQRDEYMPFTAIDEMLARNPDFLPAGPAQLSSAHALVLGFYLQLKNASEAQQCALQNVLGDEDGRLWRTLETLLAKATRGDQFDLASGYFSALATGKQSSTVNPLFGPACSQTSLQMMMMLQIAVGAGLYLPSN